MASEMVSYKRRELEIPSRNNPTLPSPPLHNSCPNIATPAPISHILASTGLPTPSPTPWPPLADKKNRKIHRNGYEVRAPQPSFKPYTINNPGHPRRKAFDFATTPKLEGMNPLSDEARSTLAVEGGVLRPGERLRQYQIEATNYFIGWRGDLCMIAPTGAGKSLVWVLPLLAQKRGVSLVIVPYTSLGHQGEERHLGTMIKSTFLHSGGDNLLRLEEIA